MGVFETALNSPGFWIVAILALGIIAGAIFARRDEPMARVVNLVDSVKGPAPKAEPAKNKPAKGTAAKNKPAKGTAAKNKPAKGTAAKNKPAKGKVKRKVRSGGRP